MRIDVFAVTDSANHNNAFLDTCHIPAMWLSVWSAEEERESAVCRGVFPTRRKGNAGRVCSMRPLWKGSISFGLVNIPVGLYSATKSARDIKFHLLRDSDHSRIRYKRVAEADEKEVSWEHIVKGYEYEKGEYVVVTDEDFQQVEIKSN